MHLFPAKKLVSSLHWILANNLPSNLISSSKKNPFSHREQRTSLHFSLYRGLLHTVTFGVWCKYFYHYCSYQVTTAFNNCDIISSSGIVYSSWILLGTKFKVNDLSDCIIWLFNLLQPGPRESLIRCFIKRNRSTHVYHLFLNLTPGKHWIVEHTW